jgi:hypothetical protein
MNAHQRRIARRKVAQRLGESPSWDDLYESDGDPFDDDDIERGTCPVCRGDGGDPMDDYLLPCGYCMGEGRTD